MSCEHIRSELPDFLTGDTPEETRRAIDGHLSECASCRAEYASLRRTLEQIAAHRDAPPDPSYWSRFSYDVNERLAHRPPRSPMWIPRIVIPSAAALLLFLLVRLGGFNLFSPSAQGLDAQLVPILSQANDREMEDIFQQYTDKTALLTGQDLVAESHSQAFDGVAQRLLTDDTRQDLFAASVDYLPAQELLGNMSADEADAVTTHVEKNLNQ